MAVAAALVAGTFAPNQQAQAAPVDRSSADTEASGPLEAPDISTARTIAELQGEVKSAGVVCDGYRVIFMSGQ
ncbi:hypothetical protein, partial [Modestobacter caceresii]|uniref:hypothetical protein n=1 Tax=Modestobacter caceresii TaxID=1522368 RepID=UPI00056850B2